MRDWRRTWAPASAAISIGLAASGFAFWQENPLRPVTVSKRFDSSDLGSMQSVGACKFSPSVIDCWDADGKEDPNLSERVRAYYIVHNDSDLQVRFGRKNRLLVFRRSAGSAPQYDAMIGDRQMFRTAQIDSSGVGGGILEWYTIDTPPSQTSAALTLNYHLPMGRTDLPLHEGGEAKLGEMSLRINSIQPAPDQTSWDGHGQVKVKAWKVSLSFTGPLADYLGASPVDGSGAPIERVDARGEPVRPPLILGINTFDASIQIHPQSGQPSQDVFLKVNPAKVASLSISATGKRKVTITDIPLDPN